MYLDIIIVATTGGLQLEGSKGVVDGVSSSGLDGPAAKGIGWVVVGKVQRLHHSSVSICDEHAAAV